MRSILLLRGLNQQLSNVERFLETRGFKISVVHRIHDAIFHITEHRPDFALFSTELIPSDSVWLFNILNQLTSVLLFAERISAKSLMVSKELRGNYLLEPPLSPLGFEQMLRRIDRDHRLQAKETPKLDKTHVLIMSALSDMALKALCSPSPSPASTVTVTAGTESPEGFQSVEKTSRITCFRVQTTRLAGFFVMAYGNNQVLDPDWVHNMQEALRKYLAEFYDQSVVEASEDMMIAEVRFPQWTKEQAEFLKSATHENAELLMAFFKDPIEINAERSLRPDHVEIGLQHFRGDSAVNFDIYVYLPKNARFVLYTPRGGILYESQKKSLLSDGVNTVHIHKHSFEEVRRQKTRDYIEENSEAYR